MDNRKINVPIVNAGKARKMMARRMLNTPTIPELAFNLVGNILPAPAIVRAAIPRTNRAK